MKDWHYFDDDFRKLRKNLRHARIDYLWGAAGDTLELRGAHINAFDRAARKNTMQIIRHMKPHRFALSLTALIVVGCSTQPAIKKISAGSIDWTGAKSFELNNRQSNPHVNADPTMWAYSYSVSGVYKLDSPNRRIQFRIDRLEMQTTTDRFGPENIISLQIGYCHFISGDKWDITPSTNRGSAIAAESRQIGVTLQINKPYAIVNIAPVVLPVKDMNDIYKAWPCRLLWSISKGRVGDIPAHQKGLAKIE